MTLLNRIRFEEPPAKANGPVGKTKHERVADKLKKRVGDYALIGHYSTPGSANSIAHMIRRARCDAYAPAGSFEAVSRRVDGEYCVYARYIGSDGDHL